MQMDISTVGQLRDLIEVPLTTLFMVGHDNDKVGVYDYDSMIFIRYITNPVAGYASFISFIRNTRILMILSTY